MLPGDWGDAREIDILAVVIDAADHVERELRCSLDGEIEVVSQIADEDPITYYRDDCAGAYRIALSIRGRKWNQLAYQFAHEFCHVLSGYETLRDNPNNWFHEAICELASLFTLRRMGRRWESNPPYPNWAGYAPNLTQYADRQMREWKEGAPGSLEFTSWLEANEHPMRGNPYMREKNGVVATKLLTAFEERPAGWNAVRQLPSSLSRIREYMRQWRQVVDNDDRSFVARLEREMFGTMPVATPPNTHRPAFRLITPT